MAALENPSYAGPFAYDFNTPQKVFLGNQPVAPLSEVIAALAAAEGGSATPMHQKIIKQQIQPQPSPQDMATQCAAHCATIHCDAGDKTCAQKQIQCKNMCMTVGGHK